MNFERMFDKTHPLFEKALELYNVAFPSVERRPFSEQERVMRNADYNCDVILENGKFIGILFFWETADFVFLEHFAILPELRNFGYGAKALSLLKKKEKTVLLEIEPPIDELTQRRFCFYKRNGFFINQYYHVQAKYYVGAEDYELKVLSYPSVLTNEEYKNFLEYMNKEISVQ